MKLIIFYFIIWAILILMLSGCKTSNLASVCTELGMKPDYIDVYVKENKANEGYRVVKFRCTKGLNQ